MRNLIRRKDRGFTLIELLVVIAIIGILAAVVLVSLGSARGKARDGKRLAEIRQFQSALELYYNDRGDYPVAAVAIVLGSDTADTLSYTNGFAADVSGTIYLSRIATSPTKDGTCSDAENDYTYTHVALDNDYTLTTCLGGNTGGLTDDNSDGKVLVSATSGGITGN